MTRLQTIGSIASVVLTLGGVYEFLLHKPINRVINKWERIDSLEARILQLESVNGKFSEIMSFNLIIYKDQIQLEKQIELLQYGKFPYDSLWLISKSGHGYMTNFEKEIPKDLDDNN